MIKKVFAWAVSGYLSFVYKTSRVLITGEAADVFPTLSDAGGEKFMIGFWHGDNSICYPMLRGSGTYIITTVNSRGSLVEAVGLRFGYRAIRLPDESQNQNHVFKIRNVINGPDGGHIATSIDGPLGPYRECKKLPLVIALTAKRRFLPVSIQTKRAVRLTRRWDKYTIPLPFSRITFTFHEPVTVTRGELDRLCADISEKMK